MNKKEIYRLRNILDGMKHIKQADTDPTATHDRFINLYKEGIDICNKSINKMKPLIGEVK